MGIRPEDDVVPARVSGKAVHEWLLSKEDYIGYEGDWMVHDKPSSCIVSRLDTRYANAVTMCIHRFANRPNVAVLWHASRKRTSKGVHVFISTDEAVLGRCCAVRGFVSKHVTVVDARLTISRACALMAAVVSWQADTRACPYLESARFLNAALQAVVAKWPASPKARPPNLREFVADAPGPVNVSPDGRSVTVAGGRIKIVVVSDDFIARIHSLPIYYDIEDCIEMLRAFSADPGDARDVFLVSQNGEAWTRPEEFG
jgi:hypothetical protein